MFFILVALGIWQLIRLDYKNSLILSIEENYNLPPMQANGAIPQDSLYNNIGIRGYLENTKTIFYYRLNKNVPGYEVLTPLKLNDGSVLLISRGWVKDHINMSGAKNVYLEGYLIDRYKGSIVSPNSDMKKNIWFDLDLEKLKIYLGYNEVLPFVLLLRSSKEFMVGEQDLGFNIHNLPNNHLGYAITWFALALVLLIIFLIDYKEKAKK